VQPGQFTVSAWAKFDNVSGYHFIVGNNRSVSNAGYGFLTNGNRLGCIMGGAAEVDGTVLTLTAGEWQHGAVTYDRSTSTMNFYRNGSRETKSCAYNILTETTNEFYIGADIRNFWYMAGYLDDIRFYNVALTESQVQSLANGSARYSSAPAITLAGAGLDVNGNLTLNSNLDVSASNYAINLFGKWLNSGVTFTPRSGTVTFDGTSGSGQITNYSQSFYNMTFNGSGTWALQDAMDVNNALTMTSGTLDLNDKNATVASLSGSTIDMQFHPTDVGALINGQIGKFQPEAERKNVSFEFPNEYFVDRLGKL